MGVDRFIKDQPPEMPLQPFHEGRQAENYHYHCYRCGNVFWHIVE